MKLHHALFAFGLVISGAALGQPYPSKPIRVEIGFSAGSSIDIGPRLVLEEIRKRTGQVITVENRVGALGQIATDFTAKSPPDGYTLMASSSATHSSGPQLAKSLPYDALKDFTQMAAVFQFDLLVVASPTQSYKTLGELIAAGRAAPNKLNFGYGSATGQVAALAFTRAAGFQAQGVPYKGQPLALTDLMGGQLNFVAVDVGAALPLIQGGKLLALGIASDKRSTILPNVPTLAEAGVKDVELSGWVGIAGPAGMPKEVTAWWQKQVTEAMAQKEVADRMRAIGLEPVTNGLAGEPFAQYVRKQYDVWGRNIRAAGIQPE